MPDETDSSSDWRAYFARYGPRLVLFARQWLPDAFDAEDAVQEAFIRFWRKHQNPDESHAGLLFAAVRHSALDHLRAEGRRRRRETLAVDQDDRLAGIGAQPHLFAPASEEANRLQTAVEQLAAEQREVLVLKVWGELTFAQIGETLGLSPNTAASRYRYAVNALRKTLVPVCHD